MKTIPISASRDYDVLIASGLLDQAGEHLRAVSRAETAVIVSGDRVFPLYGERVKGSLEGAGFRVLSFVFPHGEEHKTLETYAALLNFLCAHHLTRSDVLVALGGILSIHFYRRLQLSGGSSREDCCSDGESIF